jgi:hypothetical protein
LTICLNLYRRHFHDWMPIIELDPARTDETAPLLLIAMATIGTVYSQHSWGGLGVALGELVRRSVVYIVSRDRVIG